MTLEDIQNELANSSITPGRVAELRSVLSYKYSTYAQNLEEILVQKPRTWNHMRQNHKSDKATDREWEASEDGINETRLKLRLKRVEKMMSACKSLIDTKTHEAQGLY